MAYTRGMAKFGANIRAVDLSENQIQTAMELSKGMQNITYEALSAEEMDYPENFLMQ